MTSVYKYCGSGFFITLMVNEQKERRTGLLHSVVQVQTDFCDLAGGGWLSWECFDSDNFSSELLPVIYSHAIEGGEHSQLLSVSSW